MIVTARKFKEDGQAKYIGLLQEKPVDLVQKVADLSQMDAFTENLGVEIHLKPLVTRAEVAHHMDDWFKANPLMSSYSGDAQFWDWLSAAWMKTLIESDPRYPKIGTLNLPDSLKIIRNEYQRWALTEGTTHYHRHLISNPYFSLVANEDNEAEALCLLESNICEPGEVVERIAGTSKFNSGSICHLATLLYIDGQTKKRRAKFSVAPGNPKAFSYYFGQIDLTVDYRSMSVSELLDLLPANFASRVALAREDLLKSGRK